MPLLRQVAVIQCTIIGCWTKAPLCYNRAITTCLFRGAIARKLSLYIEDSLDRCLTQEDTEHKSGESDMHGLAMYEMYGGLHYSESSSRNDRRIISAA